MNLNLIKALAQLVGLNALCNWHRAGVLKNLAAQFPNEDKAKLAAIYDTGIALYWQKKTS